MTTWVKVVVVCNWPACHAVWRAGSVQFLPTLASEGWERREEMDFCPEHAQGLPPAKPPKRRRWTSY